MTPDIGIVWNPTKTDRETLEKGLADALAALAATDVPATDAAEPRVRWWETSVDDPGKGAAKNAIDAGAQLLVVAGGDGTVRAVAEHLAEDDRDVHLGIVPLGTGNLLARNLDVPINDVSGAFVRALTGEPRQIDVGWVDIQLDAGSERHAFVVIVGFGIDAQMIAETDDDLKDKAGWLAYVESLGRAFDTTELVPFHITRDGEHDQDVEGHTLLIANCGTLQGGITLLPDADPSDGELDYLILSAEGFGQWVGTLKTMVWDNGLKRMLNKDAETTSTESVSHGRAKRLEVTLPDARAFEVDGEEVGETRSFAVSIQPSALHVR